MQQIKFNGNATYKTGLKPVFHFNPAFPQLMEISIKMTITLVGGGCNNCIYSALS